MADNEIPAPLEDDGVPTSINGGHAASETESNSPGDPTADLPTASKVVIIDPTAILKRQVSRTQAILVVAEEHRAKVAASNGHPWSVGRPCLDSRGSSKYGLSLTAGLKAYGRTRLFSGDLVLVEIGRGDTVYRVTGRASRRAAAYFAKADLAQAGVELHTPCHYVVLGVVSQGGQP
jgi:hypothetical protein